MTVDAGGGVSGGYGEVARINYDDGVEGSDEFRALTKILDGDDDRARGMLLRFWKLAQKHWAEGRLIPFEDFEFGGYNAILASRFAVKKEEGVYARGSERFDWIKEKKEAAKAGGEARAKAARDESGRYVASSSQAPATVQPPSSQDPAGVHLEPAGSSALVLAPVLAPSPALVQKKERESANAKLTQPDLEDVKRLWLEVLETHKAARGLIPGEDYKLGQLLQAKGYEAVSLALLGVKTDKPTATWDPAKWLSLTRLARPDVFEAYVSRGAAAKAAQGNPDATGGDYSDLEKRMQELTRKARAMA